MFCHASTDDLGEITADGDASFEAEVRSLRLEWGVFPEEDFDESCPGEFARLKLRAFVKLHFFEGVFEVEDGVFGFSLRAIESPLAVSTPGRLSGSLREGTSNDIDRVDSFSALGGKSLP